MSTNTVKKRRFNVVDAVIILLLLLIVAAVGIFFVAKEVGSSESGELGLEYIVEFRQLREEFADNFHVGAVLSDSVAKYQLGEVIAVKVEPSTYNGNNMQTHELVVTEWPERVDVQLTIRTTATLDERDFYMIGGGYRVSVGSVMYVRMPDYVGVCYCIAMKETEADV